MKIIEFNTWVLFANVNYVPYIVKRRFHRIVQNMYKNNPSQYPD